MVGRQSSPDRSAWSGYGETVPELVTAASAAAGPGRPCRRGGRQ